MLIRAVVGQTCEVTLRQKDGEQELGLMDTCNKPRWMRRAKVTDREAMGRR